VERGAGHTVPGVVTAAIIREIANEGDEAHLRKAARGRFELAK